MVVEEVTLEEVTFDEVAFEEVVLEDVADEVLDEVAFDDALDDDVLEDVFDEDEDGLDGSFSEDTSSEVAVSFEVSDASEEPSVTFELPDRMLAIEDLFDDASPFAELSAQEQTDSKIGVATTRLRIRKITELFININSLLNGLLS